MSDIKRYMKEVSSLLNCADKEKAYYLGIIQNNIEEDVDQLSYEEIVQRLGTPEEWVNAHLEARGGETYRKTVGTLKRKANLLKWIVAAIVVLVLAVVIYFYFANESGRSSGGGYGDPSIISSAMESTN